MPPLLDSALNVKHCALPKTLNMRETLGVVPHTSSAGGWGEPFKIWFVIYYSGFTKEKIQIFKYLTIVISIGEPVINTTQVIICIWSFSVTG